MRTIGLAGVMMAGAAMTSFAGEWRQDNVGYWWQNDDGSYPVSSWQWLDGNQDGDAECYYFGPDGYMAANREVDGYQVNGDGAWMVDGVVQKMMKDRFTDKAQENKKAKEAYKKLLENENADQGWFCLLDINQDGIDELLASVFWPTTTIYTYQDGQVKEIETVRNEGYRYDRKNKRLLAGYANGGVENRSVHFYDGTQWVSDYAGWYCDHWEETESLLSYNDFYQEMRTERPWVYENITDKELEYQSYKNAWYEWNTFIEKYGEWIDIEYDEEDIVNVENTPANRAALLR